MNFVPAVAYHFCLALPIAFTQPGALLLAEPCTITRLPYLNLMVGRVEEVEHEPARQEDVQDDDHGQDTHAALLSFVRFNIEPTGMLKKVGPRLFENEVTKLRFSCLQ